MRPVWASLLLLGACTKDPGTDPDDTEIDTEDTVDTVDTEVDTGEPGVEPEPRVPDVIVDCEGGADFTTIGAAIAASLSGTKIGLNPCVYRENVNFGGKTLDIFGIEGSAVTTIQGSGSGAVVRAVHGESLGTRLAGVTVTGGKTVGYAGSGISIDLAVVELEDVVFTGNNVGESVLFSKGGFLEMLDVKFVDNTVDPLGGIAIIDNGSIVAQRLSLTCTDADYAIYEHAAMIVLDSDIDCGTSHGIFNNGDGIHVRRSRIRSEGTALIGSDVDDTRNEKIYLYNSAFIGAIGVQAIYMHVKAENNVFWGDEIGLDLQYVHLNSYVHNSAATGSTCAIRTAGTETYDMAWNAVGTPQAGCSDGGTEGVAGDFGFVDAPDDFTLEAGSALRDAGNPDSKLEDPDGSRNDIGITGGPEGSGQR